MCSYSTRDQLALPKFRLDRKGWAEELSAVSQSWKLVIGLGLKGKDCSDKATPVDKAMGVTRKGWPPYTHGSRLHGFGSRKIFQSCYFPCQPNLKQRVPASAVFVGLGTSNFTLWGRLCFRYSVHLATHLSLFIANKCFATISLPAEQWKTGFTATGTKWTMKTLNSGTSGHDGFCLDLFCYIHRFPHLKLNADTRC